METLYILKKSLTSSPFGVKTLVKVESEPLPLPSLLPIRPLAMFTYSKAVSVQRLELIETSFILLLPTFVNVLEIVSFLLVVANVSKLPKYHI